MISDSYGLCYQRERLQALLVDHQVSLREDHLELLVVHQVMPCKCNQSQDQSRLYVQSCYDQDNLVALLGSRVPPRVVFQRLQVAHLLVSASSLSRFCVRWI